MRTFSRFPVGGQEHRLIFEDVGGNKEQPAPQVESTDLGEAMADMGESVDSAKTVEVAAVGHAEAAQNDMNKIGMDLGKALNDMGETPDAKAAIEAEPEVAAAGKGLEDGLAAIGAQVGSSEVPGQGSGEAGDETIGIPRSPEQPGEGSGEAGNTEKPDRQPEAVDKEPQTRGEQLEQMLDKSMNKLKNAETNAEKFAAVMELLSTLIEYVQRAIKGTLGESLAKAEDANKAAAEKKNGSPEDKDIKVKLSDELKMRAEEKKDIAIDLPSNIDGLRKEKQDKIDANNITLETLDADVKKGQKDNKNLITQKSVLEQQITDLGTDESKAEEVKSLKQQLSAVTVQIDAGQKAIDAIDKQRDELAAKNKELEKEVKALDEMKEQSGKAINRANTILLDITDLLKEKLPAATITFQMEISPDGHIKIVITNPTPDLLVTLGQSGLKIPKNPSGKFIMNEADLIKIQPAIDLNIKKGVQLPATGAQKEIQSNPDTQIA